MIKIENIDVYGFEAAIRGMRNPMNSWDKSDSLFEEWFYDEELKAMDSTPCVSIGRNDLALMKKLAKAGTDHSKYLRMITVTMDITAPLYFYKEWETYKIGTVSNSCSTMHKIHEKEFALDDFSYEHLIENEPIPTRMYSAKQMLIATVENLNYYRGLYLETKDKKYWWQMIQLLPSSYNQRRTVHLNYEVLRNMYFARKNHKLDEWRQFCETIETIPYFKEIFIDE